MPPKAPQKSKEAKLLAAQSASKSKGKKKWSKGKVREKKNHRVVFTQALWDKFIKDVPRKQKVVTIFNLIEQYKINGALARRAIQELCARGLILPIAPDAKNPIYTGASASKEKEKSGKDEEGGDKKGGGGGGKKGKVGGGVKKEKAGKKKKEEEGDAAEEAPAAPAAAADAQAEEAPAAAAAEESTED